MVRVIELTLRTLRADPAWVALQEGKRRVAIGYDWGYHCRCRHDVGLHGPEGCQVEGCPCRCPPPCPCGHADVCHSDDGVCWECNKDKRAGGARPCRVSSAS
jgi:hypothetical protein